MHAYYACISYVDAQVGKLIEEVNKQGLSSNTIIVITSDHGYQLGEHELWCKHTNFEDATKVPLIVYDPRLAPEFRGRKVNNIAKLIDVTPTLWDLNGLPAAEKIDGRSFKKLLNGKDESFTLARSRYHRVGSHGYSIRYKDFRYTRWINPKTKKAIFEELYDYKNDPLETINFLKNPEYSEILKELKQLWHKNTGFKIYNEQ